MRFSRLEQDIPTPMPPGMITLWYGDIDNPPTGWAVCDGTNGTPDLRNRFVVGAGDTYNIEDEGGAATHTLTTAEMPTHKHDVSASSAVVNAYSSSPQTTWRVAATQDASTRMSHSHTITVTESNKGSGDAHNNLPPYYALAYIMFIGW